MSDTRRPAATTTTAGIMADEDRYTVPTYAKIPVALVRGQGCYVFDADGRRYLDLYGGHCVALLGHGHPALVEAIREQAGRLLFYSNVAYNDARAEAARRVAELAPEGLRRVFFCNSGTEANETALKMARRATGRRRVISMQDGFHGRTLGSLGVTGPASYRHPTYCVPADHTHVPFGDAAAVAEALDDDVAAVMLEPVPSMGGIRVADATYYRELASLCRSSGALLIFDEVQTGFGRTGAPFFGMRPEIDVRPDLITAAKGVAGGVPAGVVFVREDLAALIRPGEHGTTFGGGPLACAAMAAVARVLVEHDLPGHARKVGAELSTALVAIPGVRSVSGVGLLLGVNLDRPAKPLVGALRECGILVGSAGGDPAQLRLLPPLTLTMSEARAFVDVLTELLNEPVTQVANDQVAGGEASGEVSGGAAS